MQSKSDAQQKVTIGPNWPECECEKRESLVLISCIEMVPPELRQEREGPRCGVAQIDNKSTDLMLLQVLVSE